MTNSVAVVCESSAHGPIAKEISGRLDVPLFLGVPLGHFDFILAVTSERVELRSGTQDLGPVYVDYVHGALPFRLRKNQSPDMLLRAIGGAAPGRAPRVLDLTAGLASDSFILAGRGCEVTAVERSEIVGCLVEDGLRRGLVDAGVRDICGRMKLVIGEATDYLAKVVEDEYDVIYIDPMFPEKKKSSLPKKELQLLQSLVGAGDAEESAALLTKAGRKSRRVVVKRPMAAPPLIGKVSSSIKGRSVRFDVYIFS